jgi:hypothetical protein
MLVNPNIGAQIEKLTIGAKCSRVLALLICEEQLGVLESLVLEVSKNDSSAMLPIVKQTHAINQLDAIDMGYMNAQKERGNDSKNFGTRITCFGVVVEKI